MTEYLNMCNRVYSKKSLFVVRRELEPVEAVLSQSNQIESPRNLLLITSNVHPKFQIDSSDYTTELVMILVATEVRGTSQLLNVVLFDCSPPWKQNFYREDR